MINCTIDPPSFQVDIVYRAFFFQVLMLHLVGCLIVVFVVKTYLDISNGTTSIFIDIHDMNQSSNAKSSVLKTICVNRLYFKRMFF